MNLPQLPTDNLYKFMALTGAVLTVFSVVGPFLYEDELVARLSQVNEQIAIAKADMKVDGEEQRWREMEYESLTNESKYLAEIEDALRKLRRSGKEITEAAREASRHRERLTYEVIPAHNEKRWQAERRLAVAAAKVETAFRRSELLGDRIAAVFLGATIGISFGIVLSFAGFALWFIRVQRHQDAILKNEAKNVSGVV